MERVNLMVTGTETIVPEDHQLRENTFRYLRKAGFFADLIKPEQQSVQNIGKITCRDDRTFLEETRYSKESNGVEVIPYPMYGGVIRFSPHCPEIPDDAFRFKISPNVYHCEPMVEAIRIGIEVRNNRRLKAGGHGLHCGVAKLMGIGIFQQVRLIVDARNVLKDRSNRERWVLDGEYEIFPAYHVTLGQGEERVDRTYRIDRNHPLIEKYNMTTVMSVLNDRRFLELEAPEFLKENGLE